MIPVKLILSNFMPYRENVTPLDFDGIHLASICGDNGSGKSAIIDAITWALWGETRAGARNHDDLIHSGQFESRVEFDFKVGSQLYRVIRKHARPKTRKTSGQSSLDFFISAPDGFKPLTGERIVETQRKITEILHMDYDTFVNSSYLRQGHADQFTVADATERKQVLANILGLSEYDQLEDKARELARQRESEKLLAENSIREIDGRLAGKPELVVSLKEVEDSLAVLEKESEAREAALTDLRLQKDGLAARERESLQLQQNIQRSQRMITQLTAQADQYRSQIKENDGLVARRVPIQEGYAQLSAARKLCDELNQKLSLANRLNKRQYELNLIIDRAQAAVVTGHKLAEAEITKLEAVNLSLPRIKTDLEKARARLRQISTENEVLEQKRLQVQQLNSTIHALQASNVQLKQSVTEIVEKLALLGTDTGAACPLCERELEESHRKLIEEKYNSEKQHKAGLHKSNKAELDVKQAELKSAASDVLKTEKRLYSEAASEQSTVSLLEREMQTAREASDKIEEERRKLQEIEERLNKRAFAEAEQAALKQIEDDLARLNYDIKRHEQAKQHLSGLEHWDSPWQKLAEAGRLSKQIKESLSAAEQNILELSEAMAADCRKRDELAGEFGSLAQITLALTEAEKEQKAREVERRKAQETVGNLRGKLENLDQLETSRKEREAALNRTAKEEGIYRELAEAFGKKGIQALLIEMALPDLQDEANRLLARMTDNRMHVGFATQRETKKGDVAETLDIQIADELGTRSYEMFSGGEAFRINFAIRIALSKLLAKRAGAPLPTLIIDEGFGTQDNSGLEKLKEAIISIQEDFEKILVITHVDELRDAFPARIDVIKTPAGSTIEVNE